MPESIFVITLGDVVGIAFFVIFAIFCALIFLPPVIGRWWKQRTCKHDFEHAEISLEPEFNKFRCWKVSGYRCKKCRKEQVKI